MTSVNTPVLPEREWNDEDLAAEQALMAGHIHALDAQLIGHVRDSLHSESASAEVPRAWIDAACDILADGLPDNDPKLKSLAKARDAAVASFTNALKMGESPLPVSEEEVKQHTRELAQAIVSNAIAELQFAWDDAQEARRELLLDEHWHPEHSDTSAIREGLSAFAADPEVVVSAWEGYIAGKMSGARRFQLNLEIALATDGQKRWVQDARLPEPALAPDNSHLSYPGLAKQIESVVYEMLQQDETIAVHSEEDIQFDLVAARYVAANAVEAMGSASRHFRSACDPWIEDELTEHVMTKWNHFLRSPTGSRHSLGVSPRAVAALRQQLPEGTSDGRIRRTVRIATAATALATAASNGAMHLQVGREESNLARKKVKFGKNALASEMLQVASSVAIAAVARKNHPHFWRDFRRRVGAPLHR